MRRLILLFASCLILTSCFHKGIHPEDPYESFNRKVFRFNMVFDKFLMRPVAVCYKTVIPSPIRTGLSNVYANIYLIPATGNELLQGNWRQASDSAGRFVVNTTLGLGGILDVATQYHLPAVPNDLGITFAKWGDKKSPYVVLPFLGPSTIRDGMGTVIEYSFLTPFPFVPQDIILNSFLGVRYIDLRVQFLETDKLLAMSLDPYAFMRDAYLARRHYLITGETSKEATPEYVEEENPLIS